MEIKEATIDDVSDIAQAGVDIRKEAKSHKFIGYSEPGFSISLFRMVETGGHKVWVMRDNGELVGMLSGAIYKAPYNPKTKVAACLFVAIKKEHRGKGLSKKIREPFEEWAKQRGASAVQYSGESEALKGLTKEGFIETDVTYMRAL